MYCLLQYLINRFVSKRLQDLVFSVTDEGLNVNIAEIDPSYLFFPL